MSHPQSTRPEDVARRAARDALVKAVHFLIGYPGMPIDVQLKCAETAYALVSEAQTTLGKLVEGKKQKALEVSAADDLLSGLAAEMPSMDEMLAAFEKETKKGE